MFSRAGTIRGVRAAGLLLLVATMTLGLAAAPAAADSDKRVVTVMTYNMDAGTDFLYFFALAPEQAVGATLTELGASDFAGRAGLLADQVAAAKPDLVSLQEVTVWDYIADDGTRVGLVADQLELLKAALAERRLHYEVVAAQPLTNLALPVAPGVNFHFLDRNVLLARTDLTRAELALSNVQAGVYAATVTPLPPFVQTNGWMSVDAKIRGKIVRVLATHLESPLGASDPTQWLQGQELIGIMSQSPYPVVLAGDFNSDMSGLGVGPDLTPTAQAIVAAGYADCWTELHAAAEGLTWSLQQEDAPYGFPAGPTERIDLIFAKGMRVLSAAVVGDVAPFPSDHAGVVATLSIEK